MISHELYPLMVAPAEEPTWTEIDLLNPQQVDFRLQHLLGRGVGNYKFDHEPTDSPKYERISGSNSEVFEHPDSTFLGKELATNEVLFFKGLRKSYNRRGKLISQQWQHPIRQASILMQLDDPTIVPFHDLAYFPDTSIPATQSLGWLSRIYLVTKYIPSATSIDKYALSVEDGTEVVRILQTITDTLSYISQKRIIHGDIHPSNIIVDHTGKPYIIDFDLAQYLEPKEKEITQQIVLTEPFAPPEQLLGLFNLKTDVYSWAQTISCVLQGATKETFDNRTIIIHPDFSKLLYNYGILEKTRKLISSSVETTTTYRPTMAEFSRKFHELFDPLLLSEEVQVRKRS